MSIVISQPKKEQPDTSPVAENPSAKLNNIMWGATTASTPEVDVLVRQALNIPDKFQLRTGPVPVPYDDYLDVSIKVGKYTNDYLSIKYDGSNIYINQEYTERRAVPDRIAQEVAMFDRINALFEK